MPTKRRLPSDPPRKMSIPKTDSSPATWQGFWKAHDVEYVDTYIAGGRSIQNGRDWRKFLEERLPINGFDPFRDSKQDALYQFVGGDIGAVERSKLIIAYYPGGYAAHGTAAEMGYAAAQSTPIFYVDESEAPDLFLIGLSKRFFPDLEALCTWWARRVAQGIPVV